MVMISMKTFQNFKKCVCFAGLLFFASCDQALETGDSSQAIEVPFSEEIAFFVNEDYITHFDISEAALAEGLIREGETFDSTHREYDDVVDRLIDRVVLAGTVETLELMYEPRAIRLLHIARRQVLARLYLDHIIASRVTEDAILNMYEVQVKLQQVDDSTRYSRIVMENKPAADTAREQILMGREFDDVAAEYSTESSWKMRTDAEKFIKPNRLRAPYPEILSETPEGGVSEPFETSEGWIIVKVEERLGKAPARLDEMRQEIIEYLIHTNVDTAITNLRKRATITRPSQVGSDGDESDSDLQKLAE